MDIVFKLKFKREIKDDMEDEYLFIQSCNDYNFIGHEFTRKTKLSKRLL